MILGLRVRALDVDATVTTDNTGLTGEVLRAAVNEDQARGLHPFVLGEHTSLCIFPAGLTNYHSRYCWNDFVWRHRSSGGCRGYKYVLTDCEHVHNFAHLT